MIDSPPVVGVNDLFGPLAFGCAMALLSALWVVLSRRLIHTVVALLVHSLALAGLYLLLSADFVAVGQVLIYSGAIVVVFLFVVALLPSGGVEAPVSCGRAVGAVVAAVALLLALAAAMAFGSPAAKGGADLSLVAVGRSLFGSLIVPFELTAPLLLVAIIGAVAVWRRQEPYRDPTRRGPPG